MPTPFSAIALQQLHDAAGRLDAGATAFPHRFDHHSCYVHPATDEPPAPSGAPARRAAMSRREVVLASVAAIPWMLYNVGFAVMMAFVPALLGGAGVSPGARWGAAWGEHAAIRRVRPGRLNQGEFVHVDNPAILHQRD